VRKLSELQGDDPLILMLARPLLPKEHQRHLELAAFYPKIPVAYTQIATIATIAIRCRNSVRQSEPSGHSFRTPTERFRRISTSRSTPTPCTIR
jgi:hypothetical protein